MPHLFGTVSAVACDRSYYGTLRGPLKLPTEVPNLQSKFEEILYLPLVNAVAP